jgi:YVTN family beta-propeller protein
MLFAGRGLAVLAVALTTVLSVFVGPATAAPTAPETRDVLYVGNNWDSGDDAVSVISYDTAQEIARIPVGDHPQRMGTGELQLGLLGTKKPKRTR